MLKLSILGLLVASVLHASPSYAAARWPRRHAQESDMSNDVSFVPYNEHPSRDVEEPGLFQQLGDPIPEIDDEALQARLSEIFENLAIRVLEEAEPIDRFEVATILSDGAKRHWSSIREFLQFWSQMIADLQKRKADKDKQYHRDRSEEFNLDMIE